MNEMRVLILTAFGILALAVSGWVVASRMEANSFNAVTGKSVTTWQAMWIELRVQEQSK